MNRECKNPDCTHGGRIIMMCAIGTDYCSQECAEAPRTEVKAPPKKRAPRNRKKAGKT